MKYKIYQVKHENEECRAIKFMSLHFLRKQNLIGYVKRENYQLVYEGSETDELCENMTQFLDKLFYIFNCAHPDGYTGHSMSTSDIIELENGDCWYCDSCGWEKIDF